MEIMDTVDKEIKVGDVCWFIEHSVYGNPNAPVNEPKTYEFRITEIKDNSYFGRGTDTFGIYDIQKKYVFKTKEEALEYIKEHRDEIIKESFKKHKKWFEEQLKRARKPLF